jgi:CRISPR type IV-associated protein Csf3
VTAQLRGGIVMQRPVHLDALLGAAIVRIEDLPRAQSAAECVELPIPLARERGVYFASASSSVVEEHSLAWVNKRFPIDMAQQLGDDAVSSIQITAGINKSFREPVAVSHLERDRLEWWCIGDQTEIERLLRAVPYVASKRRFGYGEVDRWTVEPCEPWGEGFPVLRNGLPTRNLPADWPGLSEQAERSYASVRPPYWDRTTVVLAAVPV